MSVRYAILLIPHPACTARAYRVRQIICGQYGSWAAEMLMVHLMLSEFFPCPKTRVDALGAALAGIASESRERFRQFELRHQGVTNHPSLPGALFLDFTPQDRGHPLLALRSQIGGLIDEFVDSAVGRPKAVDGPDIFLPLMQYARLPSDLFNDALEFAKAVVKDLNMPDTTTAWRLVLARFQSQLAGDDWNQGGWAADAAWEQLASYPL